MPTPRVEHAVVERQLAPTVTVQVDKTSPSSTRKTCSNRTKVAPVVVAQKPAEPVVAAPESDPAKAEITAEKSASGHAYARAQATIHAYTRTKSRVNSLLMAGVYFTENHKASRIPTEMAQPDPCANNANAIQMILAARRKMLLQKLLNRFAYGL